MSGEGTNERRPSTDLPALPPGHRRLLLEVTDTEAGRTRYIHVSGGPEVPDLLANHARSYARQFYGQPTEPVPQRIAWFGEEGDGLDAT
jgi:hypothetical protein